MLEVISCLSTASACSPQPTGTHIATVAAAVITAAIVGRVVRFAKVHARLRIELRLNVGAGRRRRR